MNNPKLKQQGPDPAVMEAIQRLVQTDLDPLQEVIFKSWMEANQLEEQPDQPFDYRGLYQQTGGKVHAPGELSRQINHQNAVQTLMQAQEAHDKSSPVQMLMEAKGGPGGQMGGSEPQYSGDPQQDFGSGMDYSGGGSDMGGGGFDNSGGTL